MKEGAADPLPGCITRTRVHRLLVIIGEIIVVSRVTIPAIARELAERIARAGRRAAAAEETADRVCRESK